VSEVGAEPVAGINGGMHRFLLGQKTTFVQMGLG
jgi:hypothetical protein